MDLKHISDLYDDQLKFSQNKILKGHSARARQIIERNKINSQDGKIIDEHDQFYRDHKLLLFLFRVRILLNNIF